MPFNREGERGASEYSEVVSIVRVFPDVLTGEYQVPAKRLLQASMKFIAPAGAERSDRICRTDQKRVQHRVCASGAGKDQVFIEWGFQYARIRNAKDGVRPLHVISNAEAGFGFLVRREAVVQIAAQAQIHGPISLGDCVLHVEGEQLNVGVPV